MKSIVPLVTVACLLAANAAADGTGPLDSYNVVWESPSKNSAGSMPLGNGDIGLNVWVENDGDLLFYIGKTDAWSEDSDLVKLGRVRVHLDPNPGSGARTSGKPKQATADIP